MGQSPIWRSWNDGSQILLVVATPMQKAEKCSYVRDRRRASAGGRRERQPILASGKDMLCRQRLEVLARMAMAEPIQKAPYAQENALAGPWLKASYPAQIVRKGAQKRSVQIIDHNGRRGNESFGRHPSGVLERRDCRNPR